MEKLVIESGITDAVFEIYETSKKISIEIDAFDGTTGAFITKDQAEKLIHWLQLAVKELD